MEPLNKEKPGAVASGFYALHVRLSDGLDVVEIKDGDQNKGGKAGIEAAVIKDESTVHLCSYGADDRAHKSGKDAVSESVLSCNRTKSGRKGEAVDVRLGRERPGDIEAAYLANDNHEDEERNVANRNREYVSYMLTVGSKCKCGKYDTGSRTGKTNAHGQTRENGRNDEYEIKIRKHRKAVYGDVDHADLHSELIGEVSAVAGTFKQFTVAAHASFITEESDDKRKCEQQNEENVHKPTVTVRKRVVCIVCYRRAAGLFNAKRAIHKGVEEYTENADGKAGLIKAISMVHSGSSGQKCGDDESDSKSAYERENHTDPVNVECRRIVISYCVSEAKLADEGCERGGEKCDMDIFANLLFSDDAVKKNTDERRPHIKEIQAVEAMRHDEHITRKNGGISLCTAKIYDKVGAQATDRRIEKRAAKATESEIIGNELAG